MRNAGELGDVLVTRVVAAPRGEVYAAFTTPERLARFWGPEGTRIPEESVLIELVPGGRFYSTVVVEATGRSHRQRGVFMEVLPGLRLCFREEGTLMVGTIALADAGVGRTEVTVHQSGVPAAHRSPEALAGLESSLDRLERHLASRRSVRNGV